MKITNSYYKLGNSFYKEQNPTKIKNTHLVIFNKQLAKSLNIDLDHSNQNLSDIFSGNRLLPNSKPIALAYAGHQFGHFVPQLGDGRALLLGETTDKNGILQDIQLKGSGRTFFSRNGDGKCPLDAAIREYIVSEAMHHLKIPTTRSLAIVKSDELIQRQEISPASVITRIAKSHIRIGTFEYFAARNDISNLKILTDYTINRLFKENTKTKNQYLSLLKSVIKLQAELVSSWMSVGFIHGVMNTDNTTISGQTIDYGPCAFMDEYQANKTFSFIDKAGRYSFFNQKNIILWNLIQFAQTILPLINSDLKKSRELVTKELSKFPELFDKIYYKKMLKKIGIFNFKNSPDNKKLINDFLNILQSNNIDFTNGFRSLSKVLLKKETFQTQDQQYLSWQKIWKKQLKDQNLDPIKIADKMDKINPILIPRNHIIADIIQKAVLENDYTQFHQFLKAAQEPFKENKKHNKYYSPPQANKRVINTFCGT